MGKETGPGPQEQRFAAYIEGLAEAAGHADLHLPLKNYGSGLLLPGERKSVEPIAARLTADNVRRMHQSLHHVVADAPWNDEAVVDRVLDFVMPAMVRLDPVVAWVVDDTGFPKNGRESVGVARQYCGQVGKQENCRVAVSLSVSTEKASMPVAFRLYLPEAWVAECPEIPMRYRERSIALRYRFSWSGEKEKYVTLLRELAGSNGEPHGD